MTATFDTPCVLTQPMKWRFDVSDINPKLDQMQSAYKQAVDKWVAAIKQEEALASVNHSIAEVDKWEEAHLREDEMRNEVKAAKKRYEDALRESFFGF
jgi:energy-converting hydrogenase A subunit M